MCVSFYLFQQIINLNLLRFAGISLFRLTTFLGFVQVWMNVSSKELFECYKKPNLGSTPGGWSLVRLTLFSFVPRWFDKAKLKND